MGRGARSLLFAVLLGTGCIHQPPVTQAPSPTPVAVAYAFDHEFDREESRPPEALTSALGEALHSRNLPPQTIPFERAQPLFSVVRDTPHRFARLSELQRGSPLLLLVELRAAYLTTANGRYTWKVFVKLTAGRRGSKEAPLSNEFELPATLQYDHEREPEAVSEVAPVIATRVGTLMDTLLQLPPPLATPIPVNHSPAARLAPGTDAIYFVMVDRFANGNPGNDGAIDLTDPAAFHGGDIAGVTQHLDELAALGVKTVWLSPVFKTRQAKFFGHGAFHGYWVEDLNILDPRFGTLEELRALSDGLHARGMRLLMDMVLNHVGFDTPLTREHPEWFHHQGDIKDWNDPKQVVNGDVMGLPDLAQEKPEVQKYLLDASFKWAEEGGVDGFRLDAVRHVPLSFWARYNDKLHERAGRQFFLLGEMLDGSPAVLARTEREGRFDSLFDFPLHYAMKDVFCDDKAPSRLGAILSQDRLYPNAQELVTLLDNHDLPRVMTACHGDLERVRRALTFMLTARGTPSISYGTELAFTGEKEPLNRSDMRFTEGAPLRATLHTLLRLRQEHPALQTGASQVIAVSEGILAYARVLAGEAAVILTSTRNRPFSVGLPVELAGATLLDALTGQPVRPPVVIAPGSVRVLLASPSVPEGFAPWAELARAEQRGLGRKRTVELVLHGTSGSDDAVYLAGSGPELGNWDASRAVGPLSGRVLTVELPVDGVFEYKLVTRHRGQPPRWEPGDNHSVWVRDVAGALRLEMDVGATP